MGACQSCGGPGSDEGVIAPGVPRSPAELLNLGPEAELYFAKGGRVFYEQVRDARRTAIRGFRTCVFRPPQLRCVPPFPRPVGRRTIPPRAFERNVYLIPET